MKTEDLTPDHPIMTGKMCPYCKGATEFVDSAEVYAKSYGMVYLCRRCHAWVGVHKGTDKALGRLARSSLRNLKKAAHAAFDKIWKERRLSRDNAYYWLSLQMGLSREMTHIGMFDENQCRQVIKICVDALKKNK